MTASLEALVTGLIDYAGLYPPAALLLPEVIERYERYRSCPEGWILNRLVLPAARLADVMLHPGWRITLLVDEEPGPLPEQVETLETKLARRLSRPTYCEAPISQIDGGFAKIRTGGVTPEAIPAPEQAADFLLDAAARRMPFKATAGLHHAVRSERSLTYAPDSPHAVMHGYLNVFLAAVFAWWGAEREVVLAILSETDPRAFEFDDAEARWRGHALSTEQIRAGRREFAHSFGSCSFEEPVDELRKLGWL